MQPLRGLGYSLFLQHSGGPAALQGKQLVRCDFARPENTRDAPSKLEERPLEPSRWGAENVIAVVAACAIS